MLSVNFDNTIDRPCSSLFHKGKDQTGLKGHCQVVENQSECADNREYWWTDDNVQSMISIKVLFSKKNN